MDQHPSKKSVPPSVGADVSGIETLLNRNLPEVFGEGAARRRAAIQERYSHPRWRDWNAGSDRAAQSRVQGAKTHRGSRKGEYAELDGST